MSVAEQTSFSLASLETLKTDFLMSRFISICFTIYEPFHDNRKWHVSLSEDSDQSGHLRRAGLASLLLGLALAQFNQSSLLT